MPISSPDDPKTSFVGHISSLKTSKSEDCTNPYKESLPGDVNVASKLDHGRPVKQMEKRMHSRNKSISPTKLAHTQLTHQNSSPMDARRRVVHASSPYNTNETSFLSYLAASRPAAARGLLGVASAALAASRAGTFNPIPDEALLQSTRYHGNRSPSFGRSMGNACCCAHQLSCCSHCSHSQLWPPRPQRLRRYSDSLTEHERRKIVAMSILNSPPHYCLCFGRNDLMDKGSMKTYVSHFGTKPIIHSSLVRLDNGNEDTGKFDGTKYPSFTNLSQTIDTDVDLDRTSHMFDATFIPDRRLSPIYRASVRPKRPEKFGRTAGYGRGKKTGLDTIGWNFIQINGARPALSQFRHVREFKAAKEHELQQMPTRDLSEPVSKARGKSSTQSHPGIALLGGQSISGQQNPIHQLVSGGVLGATVLALAGKDKSGELGKLKKENRTKLMKPVDNRIHKSEDTQSPVEAAMHEDFRDRPIRTNNELGGEVERISKQTSQANSSGTSITFKRMKKQLFCSTTESEPKHSPSYALNLPRRSIYSLKGNFSAPGLARLRTEEELNNESWQKRFTSFPTVNIYGRNEVSQTLSPAEYSNEGLNRKTKFASQCSNDEVSLSAFQNFSEVGSRQHEESSSMKSKKYFTRSLSHDTDDSISETPPGWTKKKSTSRAKRRRDNFKKGRSSAFTWMVSENFEEISEYPNEEAVPLINSVSSTVKPQTVKEPFIYDGLDRYQSTPTSQQMLLTKCNAEQNVSPSLSIENRNQFVSLQSEDLTKDGQLQSTGVSDEGSIREESNELPLIRRRRDAMNNQYQQRAIRNVGYRLGLRKRLFEKRCRVSDFALAFAIFGIVVMLAESEFTFAGVYEKTSFFSYFAKSLISISTLALLGLILAYQVYAIKIFSSDDSIEDWRMAVDYNRILQIILELFVCGVHPFPGSHLIEIFIPPSFVGPIVEFSPLGCPLTPIQQAARTKSTFYGNTNTVHNRTWHTNAVRQSPSHDRPCYYTQHKELISVDLILSVPMFLRLYLLLRVMLLHSKMFTDAGSRSIGAMNKVNFDMRFIFKTLMTMCPGKLLLGFIVCLWIIYSWSLRACERFHRTEHANLLNSMWLIAVTFLSIGYGDIVPQTYCGRAIALATGVMGSGCTALIVAVFARKLELSKAEKHVIHFMMENQLNKKVKNYAANVLRETWLIYKFTKLVKKVDAAKVRTHQRKLLHAIHGLRRMKMDQRKVQDSANTLVDLAKMQSNIYETVTDLRMEQNCLSHRLERMESNLLKLQEQLRAIPSIVKTAMQHQKSSGSKIVDTLTNANPVTTIDQKAS